MLFTYLKFLLFTLPSLYSLLLANTIFAAIPTQNIPNTAIKIEQFQMGYFVDKTEKMTLDDIVSQEFIVSSNHLSLGANAHTTWVKIKLNNTTSEPINIYLHQPEAYHNSSINLYEVVDGQLINERLLDTSDKNSQKWMYRGSAIFDITLQPQQQKTLYIRNVAFSYQWFSLNLYGEEESKRALLGLYNDITLLVGMLLALMTYNFLLFLSSRLKEHLYYACYLVFGGIWISLTYGLFAGFFNVFGEAGLKWNLSLGAMPIFLLLFMTKIFETKSRYPIEHKVLLITIFLLASDAIYGLFDIVTALQYSSTLAALTMVVTLLVSISMVIRKHPIALVFLLGHGLFIFFGTLSVLFYKGSIEANYINSHGVGIGIMLEALMLSLIIAYRIRTLEALKATQTELQLQATTDPLTQLYNRRYFSAAANKVFNDDSDCISIILIDIDHFKKINDAYGHAVGDKAIIHVAEVLRSSCRGKDIVARYGGEEFIIVMPDTPLHAAKVITERIRIELQRTLFHSNQGQPISFTISAGITQINPIETGLLDAIDQADQALYQAKNNGRNQSRLYKII